MIYKPDSQGIKLEMESDFDAERSPLISQRAQYFTQQEMADLIDVSIRSIQHFEKGRNYNLLILVGYRALMEWAKCRNTQT